MARDGAQQASGEASGEAPQPRPRPAGALRGGTRLTWVDTVAGVALVVVAIASVAAPDPALAYEYPLPQGATFLLAGLAAAPYLLIRTHPAAAYCTAYLALVALALLGGYAGLLPTYSGFAILWVGFAATPPRAVTALVVTLVGMGVLGLARAPGWEGPGAFTNVIGMSAVWLVGYLMARWSERQAARVRSADRERADTEARLAAAREAERRVLARELHDSVANSLAAISVQLRLMTEELADPVERARAAALARESAGALGELRRMLVVLRDAPEDRSDDGDGDDAESAAPLAAALAAHRALGNDVTLTVDERAELAPAGVRQAIGRTVTELLANARAHAPGAPVQLSLEATGHSVRLRATNPLTDPAERPRADSFGLVGVRERIAEFGGTVTAGPQGDTYEVVIEVPGAVQ